MVKQKVGNTRDVKNLIKKENENNNSKNNCKEDNRNEITKNNEKNIEKEQSMNKNKNEDSEIIKITKHKDLNKVYKSICKIKIRDKICKGFFIKLYTNENPKYFLMTNENIIESELIEKKEIIEILYDNELKYINIKFDKNERLINEYKYINDITIIEIIKNDNINEDYFLLPYCDYNNIKIGMNIYIPQNKNNINLAKGKIKSINHYEFTYNESTEKGISGCPIILENAKEVVIGIHKQVGEKENCCVFIYPILNIFKNNKDIKIIYKSGKYYIREWKNG